MRAGIVGNIAVYTDNGLESCGQGIAEDAVNESALRPECTIHFQPERGDSKWFEGGVEIDEPWVAEWEIGR